MGCSEFLTRYLRASGDLKTRKVWRSFETYPRMQNQNEPALKTPAGQLKHDLLTLAARRRRDEMPFEEPGVEFDPSELAPGRPVRLSTAPAWSALHD